MMTLYWIISLMMAARLVHYFNTLERPPALVPVTVDVYANNFD